MAIALLGALRGAADFIAALLFAAAIVCATLAFCDQPAPQSKPFINHHASRFAALETEPR